MAAVLLTIRLQSGHRPPRDSENLILPSLSTARDLGVELPPVASGIADRVIDAVHDFHRALADANPNPLWWYLPLSEWQPFMSVLPQALELESRIATLAMEERGGRYLLTITDSNVARYLLDRFSCHAPIAVEVDFRDMAVWAFRDVKSFLLRWVNSFAWLKDNLKKIEVTEATNSVPAKLDTLFISRFETGSVVPPPDHWNDRYLGDLPHQAQQLTGSMALLVRTAGKSPEQLQALASFQDFPVVTMESLLRKRDVIAALLCALRFRLRTGSAERVISRAARREARNNVRAIADWVLIEIATERLLSACEPRQIVCMQENSSWEQAVVHAARRVRPQTVIVGFFHCPVMPSAFRYRLRADVRDRRPLFHKTISLGRAHGDALRRLGDWDALLTSHAYAFRNPQLDACLALKPVSTGGTLTVLVVLGGVFDNAVFLRWIVEALQPLDELVIEIKPHPAYDPESIFRQAGIVIDGRRIRLSRDEAMDSSLAGADMLIYKGSTVAFAGLAAGVPVVHIGDGGIASDDALFASDGLSISVSKPNELRAAITALSNHSAEQRKAWSDRARSYVRDYYDVSASAQIAVLEDLFPLARGKLNFEGKYVDEKH